MKKAEEKKKNTVWKWLRDAIMGITQNFWRCRKKNIKCRMKVPFGEWRVEPAHKDKAWNLIQFERFDKASILWGKAQRGTIGVRWWRKKGIKWSPVKFNFENKDLTVKVSWVELSQLEWNLQL